MSDSQQQNHSWYGKKKKYKRKKKNVQLNPNHIRPLLTYPNPGATLEGLKTIANFFQKYNQQPLSQPQDRPLVSGPRIRKHNKSSVNLTWTRSDTSTEPTATQNKPPEDIDGQETETKKTQKEVENSQSKDQLPEESTSKETSETPKPSIRKETMNTTTQKTLSKSDVMKQNIHVRQTNSQFDEFEIYNSPSFINFEDTEDIELNDDNLFNVQPSSDKTSGYKKGLINPNTQMNFQKKLQQQYAKKMESKKEVSKNLESSPSTQSKSASEIAKKANREIIECLSADIKTVIKDNIKTDTHTWTKPITEPSNEVTHTNYERERFPRGIPRSFLQQQNNIGAIQPQTYFHDDVNPVSQEPNLQNSVETKVETVKPQAYSPTDIYEDVQEIEEAHEGIDSPDTLEPGQKRVSAFQRLGPMTESKKPKLTINLCMNKDEGNVREVVHEEDINIPVHKRDYIINSTNEIVVKYLPQWPWKKNLSIRKSVTARSSKTVMMMEKEQIEEIYEKDSLFIMITVTGYPTSWTKEDVLDLILENLKDKSFIPCFIEFTTKKCKFFVLRCRSALLAIHWFGFCIRKDGVELFLTISHLTLTVKHVEFIPRLILRKLLSLGHDEGKLDLSEFTLKKDISHFIYFPLHRAFNQAELLEISSSITWRQITELDLSNNKIKSLENLRLESTVPKLRVLNLSNNCLASVLLLMPSRYLPIQKLYLQGNPLCLDYIDTDHYMKVVKKIFSTLKELDGVPIPVKGEFPSFKRNYCVEDAHGIVSKFLEVFFPLLECEVEDRDVKNMYHKRAIMTITCKNSFRYNANKYTKNLIIKSQNILEGNFNRVEGAANIEKLVSKWPNLQHDPTTFTVDVMFHNETSTVIKITGIFKVTTDTLADDERLVAFSRIIYLKTKNGCEYKIYNEMINWDEPTKEYANSAFKLLSVPKKTLSLKFEVTPDDESKKRLVNIFVKLTELNEKASERCLEEKNWHFQQALEHFVKLVKSKNINSLMY